MVPSGPRGPRGRVRTGELAPHLEVMELLKRLRVPSRERHDRETGSRFVSLRGSPQSFGLPDSTSGKAVTASRRVPYSPSNCATARLRLQRVRTLRSTDLSGAGENRSGCRASGMQGSLDTGTARPYYLPASRRLNTRTVHTHRRRILPH